MAKNLKLKIKKTELAKAAGLGKLKAKAPTEKKKAPKKEVKPKAKAKAKETAPAEPQEEKPRPIRRARTKSAFAPKEEEVAPVAPSPPPEVKEEEEVAAPPPPVEEEIVEKKAPPPPKETPPPPSKEKLGPTGRHIKDLLPPKPAPKKEAPAPKTEAEEEKEKKKGKKVRDFKDLKPKRQMRPYDSRDRKGLGGTGDEGRWRKKRTTKGAKAAQEENVVRPTTLSVRLPIAVKDLAAEMKYKASELVQKLFLQGMIYTLNDLLDDETVVQYLGSEFGCDINIDTSEEERIQITSESVREEISATGLEKLSIRPPVVTFMGHVDHGKTSLIDAIRQSNIVAGEAGAITQHMGAFKCKTSVGEITILDTPGHEAFSAMRARGAEVTDIVVLVVAGDEGLKEQTREAIQHAKAAGVTIIVAVNKCDKPNFNAENVYRELSEVELLPESWGGQTITINTSAVTREGIPELLEMLALQAEVLELKADPSNRARGTVLESELHKGMGNVATILVQNGTLNAGDALVFDRLWGRVKTIHDEHGKRLEKAGPSTPVEITGLSGTPSAGDPFIVVKDEKEARSIAEARATGMQQQALQQRKAPTLESLLQEEAATGKKILKLVIRGDVQGSIEALKVSLQKIESEKAALEIIFTGVGEISESDVQLAAASNAVILGFHTKVESHAESLIKELGVTIRLFDVIYHAIDDVKALMTGLLDKIEEEREMGEATVQATFKSSQLGVIAGCLVNEGLISRNHLIRVVRDGEVVWKGKIASLKRVKEDVKEVKKGFECGILIENYNDVKEGDVLQAYELVYKTQEL